MTELKWTTSRPSALILKVMATGKMWMCGRADLPIFLDLKMTKTNHKPSTDPNPNITQS